MKNLKIISLLMLLSSFVVFTACDDDEPPIEPEAEIITDVILRFTPQATTGTTVVITAQDPDGEGPLDLEPQDSIRLSANTTYTLTLELENSIANESITEEIEAEADEHMFFFGFTDALFTDPEGDGNIDNRADPVNYNDQDINGLDLGLSTTWTTNGAATGSLRIVLKHQPEIKSTTSTVTDGETDADVTFGVRVQ